MGFAVGLPMLVDQYELALGHYGPVFQVSSYLSVRASNTPDQYSDLDVRKIVCLLENSRSILSDEDSIITSKFWGRL